MLNASTMEHLRSMRFSGMADELGAQVWDPVAYMSLSFEDRVGLIVDAEWNRRHKNKLAKRSKKLISHYHRPVLKISNIFRTENLIKGCSSVLRPAGISGTIITSS